MLECRLDWSCADLVWATRAAMSMWAFPETTFDSGPFWPLAITVFHLPFLECSLSLGRRGMTQIPYVRAPEDSTDTIPCTLTTQPHTVVYPYLFFSIFTPQRTGICMALGRECSLSQICLTDRETRPTGRCGKDTCLNLLVSHYRPQRTLPSQNADLIHRQRKWFLHVPRGQVVPNTAVNLATNSLRKEVFPSGKSGPFASLLRIFKVGGFFFLFFS